MICHLPVYEGHFQTLAVNGKSAMIAGGALTSWVWIHKNKTKRNSNQFSTHCDFKHAYNSEVIYQPPSPPRSMLWLRVCSSDCVHVLIVPYYVTTNNDLNQTLLAGLFLFLRAPSFVSTLDFFMSDIICFEFFVCFTVCVRRSPVSYLGASNLCNYY